MDKSQLTGLAIFASYFLLIFGLFGLIISTYSKWNNRNVLKSSMYTFGTLTIASFAHTWFYMFSFMAWSFSNYESAITVQDGPLIERIANWLYNTALFEQAWAAVCSAPLNWWWSEQLCLFTVGAWTVFLATEGRQYSIKHVWAYMLLGQVVAISVASNLFYLALILAQSNLPSSTKMSAPRRVSLVVWLSIILSLITIGLVPFTSDRTFLPNLLVMHTLLVLPLLFRRYGGPFSMSTRTLYTLIALLSLGLRIRTILAVFTSLPYFQHSPSTVLRSLWETLHSHPAQSSIGWDVVWTTISFLFWVLLAPIPAGNMKSTRAYNVLGVLAFTLTGSVGVSAPFVLRGHSMTKLKEKHE